MMTKPVDVLNALEKINWLTGHISSSDLLTRHGYPNGVRGFGYDFQNDVRTHHVHQVHGTGIVEAGQFTSFTTTERSHADGIYTNQNLVIAVKTADCLPILLASTETRFAMAIHAGWRGLTSGILLNAINVAMQFTKVDSLIACLGPAISQEAFEVGPEVIERLRQPTLAFPNETWMLAVSKGKNDRWHVDLQVAAAIQLYRAGLISSNIEVIRSCTQREIKRAADVINHDVTPAWHSYRRDGKSCGSNWTWVQVG